MMSTGVPSKDSAGTSSARSSSRHGALDGGVEVGAVAEVPVDDGAAQAGAVGDLLDVHLGAGLALAEHLDRGVDDVLAADLVVPVPAHLTAVLPWPGRRRASASPILGAEPEYSEPAVEGICAPVTLRAASRATRSISSMSTILARGRPRAAPRRRSSASMARHPSRSTTSGHRPRTTARSTPSVPTGTGSEPGVEVVEQRGDGLLRTGLVGADEPGRTPLGPPGDVHTGADAAAVVRHGPGRRVVRQVGRPARRGSRSPGRPTRRRRTVPSASRTPVTRSSPSTSVRDRVEAQHDPRDGHLSASCRRARDSSRRAGRSPLATSPSGTSPSTRTSTSPRPARATSSGVVNDASLGAAAAEDDHLADPAARQRCPRQSSQVGPRQGRGVGGQDAGDVERDVAGADDDGPLGVERDLEVGVVGVAVVPADQVGGRHRAAELLARHAEAAVRRRADRVRGRRRTAPRGPRGRPSVPTSTLRK